MKSRRILSLLNVLMLTCAVYAASPSSKADLTLRLRDGWRMQSSCKVEKPGAEIATASFSDLGWYPVTAPSTVVSALVKLNKYPDPDFGMNLRKLPGVTY